MEERDDWRLTGGLLHELGRGDPFAAAIRGTRMPMIITDPRQGDNPIVFANESFLRLSGYDRDEVMGRNCRFLQGPDTDPDSVRRLGEAVRSMRDINIDLLNYRKDGTAFWNSLYLSPVRAESGEVQFFFASQLDVTERVAIQTRMALEKARIEQEVARRTQELEDALAAKTMLLHEVDHRVKNNLQMIASLISLQARRIPDEGIQRSLKSMLSRVDALSTVHRRLYQADDVSRFDVAEFVRDIATDLVATAGRDEIGLALDLEPVEVPARNAAPLALVVNELITNAIKHAFPDRGGTIAVVMRRLGDRFLIKIADNGRGMPDGGPRRSSLGMTLVDNLGHQLEADVTWPETEAGTAVELMVPVETSIRAG